MSALSLKTQVEEEKKGKKVKVNIYFCALSLKIMTVYKMFRYKGVSDDK